MQFFFEVLIGGLLSGVMYALVALGFVLIYKATGVFNFARRARPAGGTQARHRLQPAGQCDAGSHDGALSPPWFCSASPPRRWC